MEKVKYMFAREQIVTLEKKNLNLKRDLRKITKQIKEK